MVDGVRSDPVVAIIPARGGSKRIPRKNIKPFLGVPLLQRTLTTLLDAGLFDRIVVSTDDSEIAALALESGVEAPFIRPDNLSDDHTGTTPVVVHAIGELEGDSGTQLGNVCCVYPGAVLITAGTLRAGLDLLVAPGTEQVMTASTFPAPIQRAYRLSDGGFAEMMWPENRSVRSQDLETAYHDAGQFYWAHRDTWLAKATGKDARTRLLVLPRSSVQDIDTPEDWEVAEALYRIRQPEVGGQVGAEFQDG